MNKKFPLALLLAAAAHLVYASQAMLPISKGARSAAADGKINNRLGRIMKLTSLMTAWVIAVAVSAAAQPLTVSPEQLYFGYVRIGEGDTLELTLTNETHQGVLHCSVMSPDAVHFGVFDPEAIQARNTILRIYDAVLSYHNDLGEDPSSVEQLLELAYLEIEPAILEQWSFTLIGANPVVMIEAVSTAQMPGGAGRAMVYNFRTLQFSGYGTGDGVSAELEWGMQRTIWVAFSPAEERRYQDTLSVWAFDQDYNLIASLKVPVAGEGVLGIGSDDQTTPPDEFTIYPAYPNPFNAMTRLIWAMPAAGDLKVTIFDLAGSRIQTLFAGWKPAGVHSLDWSASGLNSGSYLVVVESARARKAGVVTFIK